MRRDGKYIHFRGVIEYVGRPGIPSRVFPNGRYRIGNAIVTPVHNPGASGHLTVDGRTGRTLNEEWRGSGS